MAMKSKGKRSGGAKVRTRSKGGAMGGVKRRSKGGAMGGVKRRSKGGAMGGKKPTKMMTGGAAMTMAQLRSAAKQKGMTLSPMKKAKGGAAKKK
tara:strand:+ start:904 stop:1185 length:282 start_codon:yes stop_codon:yes gene_type:complete